MIVKIGIACAFIFLAFLGYVSTREGKFHYQKEGLIKGTPDMIFPYLSNLRLGEKWSPYEALDPNMKKTFSGEDGSIGSKMEFSGNSDVGSGSLEITNIVPNESVEIKLIMTSPVKAENNIRYTLRPLEGSTHFVWAMYGDSGFLGKLMGVFIDCEKMMTSQFDKGIENLKQLMEEK